LITFSLGNALGLKQQLHCMTRLGLACLLVGLLVN